MVVAVLLAACGTGGVVERGNLANGRTLFQAKCASCHSLAAAGSTSEIGPNLDASFAQARAEGFKDSSIRDIVAGQIRDPGQYATGDDPGRLKANMPPDLVEGQDLADVATFVAENAGRQGFVRPAAVRGTNGQAIFKARCASCHTLAAAGASGTVGPNLDRLKPSFARAEKQVINGGGAMPAFKGLLTDAQIKAVARYVAENAGK